MDPYNLSKWFNFSPMGVSWGVTRSECEPCPEVNTEEHEGKTSVFKQYFIILLKKPSHLWEYIILREINVQIISALCRPALNDIIGNICRGDQCGINFGNEYVQTGESHNNNICVTQRNICGFNGVCIPSNNQAGNLTIMSPLH